MDSKFTKAKEIKEIKRSKKNQANEKVEAKKFVYIEYYLYNSTTKEEFFINLLNTGANNYEEVNTYTQDLISNITKHYEDNSSDDLMSTLLKPKDTADFCEDSTEISDPVKSVKEHFRYVNEPNKVDSSSGPISDTIFVNFNQRSWEEYIVYVICEIFFGFSRKILGNKNLLSKDFNRHKEVITWFNYSLINNKGMFKLFDQNDVDKEAELTKIAIDYFNRVDLFCIESFCSFFNLKNYITEDYFINELTHVKRYEDLVKVLQILGVSGLVTGKGGIEQCLSLIDSMIDTCFTNIKENLQNSIQKILTFTEENHLKWEILLSYINKVVSKFLEVNLAKDAALILIHYKFQANDYPEVRNCLYRNACKYFFSEYLKAGGCFERFCQLFINYPTCIGYIAQNLEKKNKYAELVYLFDNYGNSSELKDNERLIKVYKELIATNTLPYVPEVDQFASKTKDSFTIPLEHQNYYFIKENDLDMLFHKLSESKLLAFDSEWNPISTVFGKPQPAILQICNEKMEMFILDVIELKSSLKFITEFPKIMKRDDIKKTGFYFYEADVPKFRSANLPVFDEMTNFEDILELKLIKKIKGSNLPSASDIFKLIFGKNLCKEERISNWEARPLRQAQLHYACLDVYSLVMIYNKASDN